MLVRRFLVGGAVAAALVLSGCGGGADDPGVAAPSMPSMPSAPAATAPAADPTTSGPAGAPGGVGGCVALSETVATALTKVAGAGLHYDKAAAEFRAGAAAVRAKLGDLPAASRKAGEDLASAMDEAAAGAGAVASGDAQPYLDAQKKVGDALVALGTDCN